MTELPYVFDLLYDIKTMKDVEKVAKGWPIATKATPEDLVSLFLSEGIELPEYLKGVRPAGWVDMDFGARPDYDVPVLVEMSHLYVPAVLIRKRFSSLDRWVDTISHNYFDDVVIKAWAYLPKEFYQYD